MLMALSRYEIAARYILPALRAMVANGLIVNYKMTQTEVAKRIGMTQAAISQYARGIRGVKKIKCESAAKAVMELCERISKNQISCTQLNAELFSICSALPEEDAKSAL